jgi:hypothetical protein
MLDVLPRAIKPLNHSPSSDANPPLQLLTVGGVSDYLDREALLALDLPGAIVDRLLLDTPLTGDGGRPVIAADRLDDLLGLSEREGRQ